MRARMPVFTGACLFVLVFLLLCLPVPASALPPGKTMFFGGCGRKDHQLQLREEALKVREQRLKALKKDIDKRITRYKDLLAQVNSALKELKATGGTAGRVVAVYAAMPPSSAAAAISGLDLNTAVKIILGMQPRKAAAVMSDMPPAKVVAISSAMLAVGKKIPTK